MKKKKKKEKRESECKVENVVFKDRLEVLMRCFLFQEWSWLQVERMTDMVVSGKNLQEQ